LPSYKNHESNKNEYKIRFALSHYLKLLSLTKRLTDNNHCFYQQKRNFLRDTAILDINKNK